MYFNALNQRCFKGTFRTAKGTPNECPGRAAHYFAAPPQFRTSGFPAYGSSQFGFAER